MTNATKVIEQNFKIKTEGRNNGQAENSITPLKLVLQGV